MIADQQPFHVASDRRDDRFLPTPMIAVRAEDQGRSLFHPAVVGELKIDQNNVTATQAYHKQSLWNYPTTQLTQDQSVP